MGITLTFELLYQRPDQVVHIYIHSSFVKSEVYDKLIALCHKNHVEYSVNDKIFNILSNKENCFVIGKFNKYGMKIKCGINHLVLVNPSNAGNLGTILRSCLGFGIKNVAIVRPAVDIFDPKVIRASMGAFFGMEIQYFDNISDYMKLNPGNSLYPFMLNASGSLKNVAFVEPYSLIFGNEATGLPEAFHEIGTSVVIRHSNAIDSLNLPIAVSIALYEISEI